MSEPKSRLMAVSKMLYKVPHPVSDVALVFPGSKSGQMALSLDARMRSAQILVRGKQLTIYWRILDERGNTMTSDDATYLKCTILSSDDPRIQSKEYRTGDKFALKYLDDSFSKEIASLLEDKRVILEVLGYALTLEGEVVYDMHMINIEDECSFRWLLSEQDLKESFYYLGDDFQQARFVLIDV